MILIWIYKLFDLINTYQSNTETLSFLKFRSSIVFKSLSLNRNNTEKTLQHLNAEQRPKKSVFKCKWYFHEPKT